MTREYPGPFAGPVNRPPTSMDLALLDAVLDQLPFCALGGYLFYRKRELEQERAQQGARP